VGILVIFFYCDWVTSHFLVRPRFFPGAGGVSTPFFPPMPFSPGCEDTAPVAPLNKITPAEEAIFLRQLDMAKALRMLVLIHSPHDTPEVSKRKGVARTLDILQKLNYEDNRIIVDHNTGQTMDLSRKRPVWGGLTVYP